MNNRDRTVHACYDGMNIVRYDRMGKWYLEPTDPTLKREAVKLVDAARTALWGVEHANGRIFPRLPGGGAFDRAVAALSTKDGPT